MDKGKIKVKDKTARPWHLLNKKNWVGSDVAKKRLDICMSCPELLKTTIQCKRCGCFMEAKTKLANAECPLEKWGKENLTSKGI